MTHPTPPSFEEITRYILLERGSTAWLAVNEANDNSQPCWKLWNASSDNLEVWIARQSVTLDDLEAVRQIAQRLTDEMNTKPVVDITGADIPTFGELYDLRYIGVILTCTEPEPEVLAAAEASPDVYLVFANHHQTREVVARINLMRALEAINHE